MKSLLAMFPLLLVGSVFGQTDALNLEKYWKFRNEFVEKFVKIGDQPQPTGVSKRSPIGYIPVF